MSLLEKLRAEPSARSFDSLGFTRNPFPPRGQVQGEVYVERPELVPVEDSLARFLMGESAGRIWAIAGDSGIGKSNFLRHLVSELDEAKRAGAISGVAYRYLTSQQMSPRQLAEAIASAFGLDPLSQLFGALQSTSYEPTQDIKGTALGDFLATVAGGAQSSNDESARFAIRWLGGQQTYIQERSLYGISMRERTPPAVALPWLRYLLDLMTTHGILSRLILMLDEFEDVQSLSTAVQNDYLMTLKGLINAFNLDNLFLVLAGQPAAFERMGQRFPSLMTRWQVVGLEGVRRPEDAVRLARQYVEYEHRQWLAAHPQESPKAVLPPSDLEIKALFGELLAAQPARGVTQRDLLSHLHDRMENYLRQGR